MDLTNSFSEEEDAEFEEHIESCVYYVMETALGLVATGFLLASFYFWSEMSWVDLCILGYVFFNFGSLAVYRQRAKHPTTLGDDIGEKAGKKLSRSLWS